MLDSGAICPSQSACCNAVVLVRKKDGGLHFCIDFWCLNAHMKKDHYPLPRIQEVLESLVGAGYFSCLDLKSGFWQIKMDESSKQYTVFTVGNVGFFKCNHMPFGLCNAPATFQRLMQNCLGVLNLIYCLIYLNHIVVFLHTTEEHLHHLCIVFDWFREHNLKLKPSKCNFVKKEITYLVHWVSKNGVQPSNSNFKAIAECALPQTYTEVCGFLGLVGHYRRFTKDLHILHSHLMNIWLEKEPAESQSRCHFQGMLEGSWSIETGMHDSSSFGFHWLHQTILVGDWCIQGWIRGSAVTEARGQVISPSCLWQQSPHAPWEELSLDYAWVPGIEVGGYRTFQGVPALSNLSW